MKAICSISLIVATACLVASCETARLPFSAGVGPNPTLPPPNKSLIPTVLIAPAKGWPDGAKPGAAAGTRVAAFAVGLDHPRWIFVLPNGDVLVAETAAPPQPEDNRGFKGWIMKKEMRRVGAEVPSANRITLLRDADGDGVAEVRTVFLEGLHSPFGMPHLEHTVMQLPASPFELCPHVPCMQQQPAIPNPINAINTDAAIFLTIRIPAPFL